MKKIIVVIIVISILLTVVQVNAFASGNGTEALYKTGMDYFEKKDYDSAFSYFLISGERKGYAPSQNMLGVCYRDGLGTAKNIEEAEKYFKLSGNQGFIPAQENLAALYDQENTDAETEKSDAYQDAMNLFFEGKYEEAKTAFKALGGYEHSADFIAICEKEIQDSKRIAAEEVFRVGDYIQFGVYEQDNNISNGKEPIEWLVLDIQDRKVLVISKYVLDWQPYCNSLENGTWEKSVLRTWLNQTFINIAFTPAEQTRILTTENIADISSDANGGSFLGNDTNDQIFLLSTRQLIHYFGPKSDYLCYPTEYVMSQGCITLSKEDARCRWWVRLVDSRGINEPKVACADPLGCGLFEVDHLVKKGILLGVRPALWITSDEAMSEADEDSAEKSALGSIIDGEYNSRMDSELYLVKYNDGVYDILNDPIQDYDKLLTYDSDGGNYYDKESDCWLWHNTDVTPAIWQYWYNGISSDYGDYGWMEWDEAENIWYIEESDGNWIKLPSKYYTGHLWHIFPQ